jgi:dTDP-4-dehydrorhamnose reductase
MTRVVVLGANGQLGRDLSSILSSKRVDYVPLEHKDLDVCDYAKVAHTLHALQPETVVNTTAVTGVDLCESELERSFEVNCYAVRHLAGICRDINARLVHISTDYVFGGSGHRRPFREDAPVSPLNVYGVSKASGEFFVRSMAGPHLIVRTSGLYGIGGATGKGGNFVETMLRIGGERDTVSVVTDQVLSPTYTRDMAETLCALIDAGSTGVFHVTNSGSCSWFEFAQAIFAISGMNVDVQPTTSDVWKTAAKRPSYSVLDNYRLRREGFVQLRPWRQALAAYIAARKVAACA